MDSAKLDAWLAYVESLHPKSIALGLDRVRCVHARLDAPISCPVVTVGGTNGKGSTCALLESMLRCAGYRTGLYTSPHLLRYNERVRIAGVEASDEELVAAFMAVEDARLVARDAQGAPVALTYFEFGTLAALWLFAREALDVLILEVGLGGRLDAVNIVDPDVAVVTSIDVDHVDYLGSTREDIGREKAGIFREGRPAVCADPAPPRSLLAAAGDTQMRQLVEERAALVQSAQSWRSFAERSQLRPTSRDQLAADARSGGVIRTAQEFAAAISGR